MLNLPNLYKWLPKLVDKKSINRLDFFIYSKDEQMLITNGKKAFVIKFVGCPDGIVDPLTMQVVPDMDGQLTNAEGRKTLIDNYLNYQTTEKATSIDISMLKPLTRITEILDRTSKNVMPIVLTTQSNEAKVHFYICIKDFIKLDITTPAFPLKGNWQTWAMLDAKRFIEALKFFADVASDESLSISFLRIQCGGKNREIKNFEDKEISPVVLLQTDSASVVLPGLAGTLNNFKDMGIFTVKGANKNE